MVWILLAAMLGAFWGAIGAAKILRLQYCHGKDDSLIDHSIMLGVASGPFADLLFPCKGPCTAHEIMRKNTELSLQDPYDCRADRQGKSPEEEE